MSQVRFALRMVAKTPGFFLIAVLTLALGIGANSAIFSVIDAVLLRPLPFPKSNELVAVWSKMQGDAAERETGSFLDYADIREQSQKIANLFAYTRAATILGTGNEAHELLGIATTADIFPVLGVSPFLGRTFTAEEDKTNAHVVVLTYEAWQRYFNRDPNVIGRQVLLSLRPYSIVGVMPARYHYPIGHECEYFMPLQQLAPDSVTNRGSHFLQFVGRLKPQANVSQASLECSAIAARLEKQFPDSNTGRSYYAISLRDSIVGDVRPALLTMLAAVVVVLLIACANVANLLLARANQRQREI